MNKDEAWIISEKITSLEKTLRENFPCEECNGKGIDNGKESWYGWNPCESCYGQGWMVDWDDEDE